MHGKFTCTVLSLALSVAVANAAQLPSASAQAGAVHELGQKAQKRINQLDLNSQEATETYLANERMADLTEAYNQQMAQLVASQQAEMADLQQQIDSIEEMDQSVLPMLNRMLSTLQQFVSADTPFLPQERQQRIARLHALLKRADISVAEKYRQILQAYLVEVEYGRTLEAYSGSLPDAEGRQVTFLRLGRVALYYQSLDRRQSALWQPSQQRWQMLDEAQNLALGQAIQVALQQQVPALLNLPLPAMEVAHAE
ncbi:DUF3450 domain-containing protein [Neptuniibacter halophilus]|uniref:DUF3450 domain-containing protein n=1 Tax=Neptuniibacter halophilus TaxID=651666 RepID=UPI0025739100|nr:DUF3450 domain-containing protein [Neptuniibacter halophilus]